MCIRDRFIGCTQLCYLHLTDILFQPVHKLRVRHTIFNVGISDILNFRIIFDGLHKNRRIFLFYSLYPIRDIMKKGKVQPFRVQQYHITICLLYTSRCVYDNDTADCI